MSLAMVIVLYTSPARWRMGVPRFRIAKIAPSRIGGSGLRSSLSSTRSLEARAKRAKRPLVLRQSCLHDADTASLWYVSYVAVSKFNPQPNLLTKYLSVCFMSKRRHKFTEVAT